MGKYIYADKKPVGIIWEPTRDISAGELIVTIIGTVAIVGAMGYLVKKKLE